MKHRASLMSLAFLFVSTALFAAASDTVPTKVLPSAVSGTRTPDGMRITSKQLPNPFSIEIAGKDIRALSAERLQWSIDGRTVELELAVFQANAARGRSEEELLNRYRDWELGSLARDRWVARGSHETFTCGQPKTCLLWVIQRPGAPGAPATLRYAAAAMNGVTVVLLTASTDDASSERALVAQLQTAVRTIKPEALSPSTTQRPNLNDPNYRGESLAVGIGTVEMLTGQPHAAILNNKLMSAKDAQLRKAVPVEPAALLEFARFLLESGVETMFTANVFDGRSAHAINMAGAPSDSNVIEYWDPWGKGSFLQKANNAAGVDVTQHPTKPRIWIIGDQDLERVLYAVILPEQQIVQAMRIFALIDKPAEALASAISEMRGPSRQGWIEPLTSEANLRKIAKYLQAKKHKGAFAMYRAIAMAYPDSTRAKQDLERAAQELGRPVPVALSGNTTEPPVLLSGLLKTEFFTFFHLQRAGAEQEGGSTRVIFRPGSDKFRELVSLVVVVDGNDVVLQRQLSLSRAFIDHPRDGIFARDIAKSHLLAALSREEKPQVAELVGELFRPRSLVSIPGARRDAKLPMLTASAAYLTYLGRREAYQRNLMHHLLKLANVTSGETRTLIITIAGRH
jgi:hypothetical protein